MAVRVVSLGPFVEACKDHAMLALPVLMLASVAAVVVAAAADAVIDGDAVAAVVCSVAVAVDAVVALVVAPTILRLPPLLSNQRSCH